MLTHFEHIRLSSVSFSNSLKHYANLKIYERDSSSCTETIANKNTNESILFSNSKVIVWDKFYVRTIYVESFTTLFLLSHHYFHTFKKASMKSSNNKIKLKSTQCESHLHNKTSFFFSVIFEKRITDDKWTKTIAIQFSFRLIFSQM